MTESSPELTALIERLRGNAVIADDSHIVRELVGDAALRSDARVGEPMPPALAAIAQRVGSQFVAVVRGPDPGWAVANLSHELRTPLNAIVGMAELLAMARLEGSQRRQLELLQRAASGLGDLLDRLLQLQRLGSGWEVAVAEPFHLYDVLESVLDLFSLKARHRHTELGIVVADNVSSYRTGDAGRLRQVLTNLVGNAVKHTSNSDIVVRVTNGEDEDVLLFEVTDGGDGVPQERRSRLFAPFWQLEPAAGDRGVGLGLAISQGLVELMGGELAYAPAASSGSSFRFDIRAPAQDEPDRVTPPSLRLGSDRSVLLFEDQPLSLETTSAILAGFGVRPKAATNLDEVRHALASAPDQDWSVIASIELARADPEGLRAALAQPTKPPPLLLLLPFSGSQEDTVLASQLDAIVLYRPLQRRALLQALAPVEQPTASAARKVSPATVLVCDDAEDVRLFTTTVLAADGHRVEAVGTGAEALALLRRGGFDVALIDIEMRGMSGVEVVHALSAEERAQQVLVACTAHDDPAVVDKLSRAGFHRHLAKPMSRAALLEEVRAAAPKLRSTTEPAGDSVEARMALLRRDWDALALIAQRAEEPHRAALQAAIATRDPGAVEVALQPLAAVKPPSAEVRDSVRLRLAALVPRFLAQRAEDLDALRSALVVKDFEQMRFIGHRIAGSSKTYGFPELGLVGRDLENAAERGDEAKLALQVEALALALARTQGA